MAAPIRPAERLMQLAREARVNLPCMARVIDRSPGYLRARVRDGYSLDLRRTERETLAQFFGVPVRELGG